VLVGLTVIICVDEEVEDKGRELTIWEEEEVEDKD
jgi:hypothetical protein